MENRWGRKLHFFKVLIGDFQKRLRIPQAFVKHISEESSERAILEGPSGSHWHVKLKRTTNDMYLQDGWEKFSRDHSLRGGEFLVFSYDGNMHFSVKIFATSACEREDAFAVKASKESVNRQGRKRCGTPVKVFKRNKRGKPWKNSLDPSHVFQCSEKHTTGCMLEQQCPHQYDRSDSPRGQMASLSNPFRLITVERNARKAAYSFSSSFPFFVTEMKASNLGIPFNLYIPACFARAHLPRASTKMILRNQEGNTWTVSLYAGSNQNCVCGGWNAFARDNHLKKGDYCVFELVDEVDMQVHIFRVGCLKSC